MRLSPRRGFTLVELLVAVVLVNVGLLALVGTSAVVVRRHRVTRSRAIAAQLAGARLELLAASPCNSSGGPSSGSSPRADGIREMWEVGPIVNGARELDDSVVYADGTGQGSVALRTRVAC